MSNLFWTGKKKTIIICLKKNMVKMVDQDQGGFY